MKQSATTQATRGAFLASAILICPDCRTGNFARDVSPWGWIHGTPGRGITHCPAWRIHAALQHEVRHE